MVDEPDQVQGVEQIDSDDFDALRELIKQSFELARKSGRAHWNKMTIAVLKNRLLQLTSRQFSEHSFGSDSMLELVGSLPDLLLVDESANPPTVELVDSLPETVSLDNARLRDDLWNAVFDYASESVYIWDGSTAVRRGVEASLSSEGKVIPTLSAGEMSEWRLEFSAEHDRLDWSLWESRAFSSYALPGHLRASWNFFLKRKALTRLREWFSDQGVPLPSDILVEKAPNVGADSFETSEVEELRRFVARCVADMRPAELRSLQLPASVAARVGRR